MLKQAFDLWKSEKRHKGTTLQRRLILFFASVTIFLILAFALLLMFFGINGKGEKAAWDYMTNELSHVSEAIGGDFGRLSLLGINMSDTISNSCDSYFADHGVSAAQLPQHPELLEQLIAAQMPFLKSAMNSNTCSGVYLLLDATVNPNAEKSDAARAGFYLRSTQPLSSQTVGTKHYCLRGPAQVARDNGIELLGQWKMEYDITDEDFFELVMDTARENETLPLSRLYYWTGRVTLHGNSEASFLLCVPLRSTDGTVYGVCGIEVSDRMFKQQYSPQESDYKDVFTVAAPVTNNVLQSSQGLFAGNSFLTGHRMTEDLSCVGAKSGFYRFRGDAASYGGLIETVKLYPTGSPYAGTELSVAVLMPEELLNAAIKGNSAYLFLIIVVLLIASLTASVLISHRYLRPVKKALHMVQNRDYEGSDIPYLEINDLFDFLAEKDNEHEEEMRQLDEQRRGALSEAEQAKQQAEQLADKRREEIDRDSYAHFIEKLKTLTPKEREVFNLYLDRKSAKEIVVLLDFSENTLKYHNKNIYGKLGVASRKELLMYVALMKQDAERTEKA